MFEIANTFFVSQAIKYGYINNKNVNKYMNYLKNLMPQQYLQMLIILVISYCYGLQQNNGKTMGQGVNEYCI